MLVEVDACRKLQHARSRELCESVIEALTEALQTKIRARKDLSLEILKKDIRTLVRKYNEHAKGPSRESLLIAWLSGSLLDILGIVVDKRVSMAESPLKKRIYELEVSQEDAHQRLEKEIERFSLLVAEKDNEMKNLRDILDSTEREMKRALQVASTISETIAHCVVFITMHCSSAASILSVIVPFFSLFIYALFFLSLSHTQYVYIFI